MSVLNEYSIAHFLLWIVMGRFTGIGWAVFLMASLGWECLEWGLPFEFAIESTGNKCGDVAVNILGFGGGYGWRRMAKESHRPGPSGSPP